VDEPALPIVATVPARAALAGNPSDGYGGAVFAVPVPAYGATVRLDSIDRGYELVDAHFGFARYARWADLEQAMTSVTAGSPHCLLLGVIAEVAARKGPPAPFRLSVDTTIPLSVGLAGSSAIVIAALRVLMRSVDDAISTDELAVAAQHIETHRLGIAAGLQDRVVQAYNRPMLMQFDPQSTRHGPGVFTPVRRAGDFHLFVASLATTSEPSQIVHGDLRARFDSDDQTVTDAMPMLADRAVDAAAAFAAGDVVRLGLAMDATFDMRGSILNLARSHVEMIEAARAAGAYANFTGSGGSVVVLAPSADVEAAARQSLNKLGCMIVSVETASPDAEPEAG
jgi:glucuronokinase